MSDAEWKKKNQMSVIKSKSGEQKMLAQLGMRNGLGQTDEKEPDHDNREPTQVFFFLFVSSSARKIKLFIIIFVDILSGKRSLCLTTSQAQTTTTNI
jgi:hypothetical protein